MDDSNSKTGEEPAKKALPARQVSRAPAPITPLGGVNYGGASRSVELDATRQAKAAPRANWKVWGLMPTAALWQAVALSLDKEPEAGVQWWDKNPLDEADVYGADFPSRLMIAEAHLREGLLTGASKTQGENGLVRLAEFAAWAEALKWDMPAELANHRGSGVAPAVQTTPAAPAQAKGTARLQKLEAMTQENRAWWDKDLFERAQDSGAVIKEKGDRPSNNAIAIELARRIALQEHSRSPNPRPCPDSDTVRKRLTGWRFKPDA